MSNKKLSDSEIVQLKFGYIHMRCMEAFYNDKVPASCRVPLSDFFSEFKEDEAYSPFLKLLNSDDDIECSFNALVSDIFEYSIKKIVSLPEIQINIGKA